MHPSPSKQGVKPHPLLTKDKDLEKGEILHKLNSPARHKGIPHSWKAGVYLLVNVASATSIVFANKTVFSVLGFKFVYALTLLHVLTTWGGMRISATLGFYEPQSLPLRPLLSLSAAFVGYIVFWNIALQVNTVGFYQLSKICITPAVLVFDALTSKVYPTKREVAAVCILCIGVTLATVADGATATNLIGFLVALSAICTTAVYQVFAGSKQKELEVGSMALMAGYTPIAAFLLAVLVPIFEPIGIRSASEDTLLGYHYTLKAVCAIALTCLLGLLVSLSTFLVIGATSSVTYNVVGHVKTVIVMSGGCLLFGEDMSVKRFLGITLAMSGIVWYTFLKIKPAVKLAVPEKEPLLRGRSFHGQTRLPFVPKIASAASIATMGKIESSLTVKELLSDQPRL